MGEIGHILTEFKEALAQLYSGKMRRLVCYGSQARRDAGPESDIDLILILDGEIKPSQEIDRVIDLLADLNLRYGVLISLLPVGWDTWEKADGPFCRNIRREGVEI